MKHSRLTTLLSRAFWLGLVAALALPAGSVGANGNPVSVVLAYLNGVSNWGPQDAAGVADLVPREGDVKVTATGLPRLQGEHYQVWLNRAGSGDWYSLGSFNTGADGTGRLVRLLDEAIPDRGWDLVVVSVEADSAQAAQPGSRRSIAGRFPPPPPTGGSTRPPELPRTGGDTPTFPPVTPQGPATTEPFITNRWLAVGVAVVGALLVGAFALGRSTRPARRE